MSQYLVVFFNNTKDTTVQFVNIQSLGDNQTVLPATMFRTTNHFNIPDNSNSSSYFSTEHMEIRDHLGTALFSFWDDDLDGYNIKYCKGTDWEGTTAAMPGYYNGGNQATVGLVLSDSGSNSGFIITAIKVMNNV